MFRAQSGINTDKRCHLLGKKREKFHINSQTYIHIYMVCGGAESKHAACANHLSAVIYRVLRQCNSRKKSIINFLWLLWLSLSLAPCHQTIFSLVCLVLLLLATGYDQIAFVHTRHQAQCTRSVFCFCVCVCVCCSFWINDNVKWSCVRHFISIWPE